MLDMNQGRKASLERREMRAGGVAGVPRAIPESDKSGQENLPAAGQSSGWIHAAACCKHEVEGTTGKSVEEISAFIQFATGRTRLLVSGAGIIYTLRPLLARKANKVVKPVDLPVKCNRRK